MNVHRGYGSGPDLDRIRNSKVLPSSAWAGKLHETSTPELSHVLMNVMLIKGVPEREHERMIVSTLSCQRDDGLFQHGGMCANMDAVDLLAEHSLVTDLMRKEAVAACRRCVKGIFEKLLTPCGGFRFKIEECPRPSGEGYGDARLTNGTAFVLNTIRSWQAIDEAARTDLGATLKQMGARYRPSKPCKR